MADCEFCAIAAADEDGYMLHEDDRTLAFLDANPAVRGHALVVPKDHRPELFADEDADDVFETVRNIANRLDEHLDCDGFSLFYTTETLVGSVDHAHVDLLPRRTDDGVSLALDRQPLNEVRADALASPVRPDH
jgi:histidine triad (HIT) family protein